MGSINELDLEFLLVIIKIVLSSMMVFFSVLLSGKTRKVGFLFLTLSIFLFYLKVIYEVLEKLNIFYISEIKIFNLSLIPYIVDYSIYLFFIIAIIIFLATKNRKL